MTVSPSSQGKRPAMKKMYDGRNVATRPIPVFHDTGTDRAIAAAAIDQIPKTEVVNWPDGPRPAGTGTVFGSQVAGATKISGGVYNPSAGQTNTL